MDQQKPAGDPNSAAAADGNHGANDPGAPKREQAKAAEAARDHKFWARTRATVVRNRAVLGIALVAFLIVYGAIVQSAWRAGARGNSADAPSGTPTACTTSTGR